MRTTRKYWNLFAALSVGVAVSAASGCSTDWLRSPSADYAKPGEWSKDVSALPDPSAPAPPREKETSFNNFVAARYGGAPMKESPERLLLQANAYFEENRFHDSARLYQKYLATPEAQTASAETLATAHYRIGFVARKKMNLNEAKTEFETALKFAPKNIEYRFALGKTCFESNDYAGAQAALAATIAADPNYPEAQYYFGLTLLEDARRAEALGPLTAAVGELQANAMLADKYYEIGALELAAQAESQTAQIAAKTGKALPPFPHKSTSAPQVAQTPVLTPAPQIAQTPVLTPAPQIAQTPVSAPASQVAQTPVSAPASQVAQTPVLTPTPQIAQTPVSAPASQVAQTPSNAAPFYSSLLTPRVAVAQSDRNASAASDSPSNVAPSRLLLPALAETLARSKKKIVANGSETDSAIASSAAPSVSKPVETEPALESVPTVAPTNETFASAAFDATTQTADALFAEPSEPAEALEPSLNNDFVVALDAPTAASNGAEALAPESLDDEFAPPASVAPSNAADEIEALLAAQTPIEPDPVAVAAAPIDAGPVAESASVAETEAPAPVPAQLGRRNPGLFAASDATPNPDADAFKPGSIGSVAPRETPEPTALLTPPQLLQAPRAPESRPVAAPTGRFALDAKAALAYVAVFETAEELVASFESGANGDFNESEEFAFASSGAPVPAAVAPPTSAAVDAPNLQALAQNPALSPTPTPRPAAPKSATFAAYQNGGAASASRRARTPEERLEAARAAGAEIRELTPDEYRRAVSAGLSKNSTTK